MKITPETYEKMNEEFIKDNTPFIIVVPTQEAIDKWQAKPAPPYSVPRKKFNRIILQNKKRQRSITFIIFL